MGAASPGRHWRGFTLIELLVALVIVGILTAASVGGYRRYVQRASRVDATSALLRIQGAQERFYLQNNRYAGTDELATAPPAGLGIAGTDQGHYVLRIDAAPGGLALGYSATATAVAGGPQGDDAECQVFGIDQGGLRSAADGGGGTGSAVTTRCWR